MIRQTAAYPISSTMAQIVAIHGVVGDDDTQTQISKNWYPALQAGLEAAGYSDDFSFQVAYYGDLLRTESPNREQSDWGWQEIKSAASALYNAIGDAELEHLQCRRALFKHLMQCPTLQGLGDELMRHLLTQVWRYFHAPGLRSAIHARLIPLLQHDTRVLIAHSLGSVAAYEVLCQHSLYGVDTLITMGSPLGASGLVFERLRPPPIHGMGKRPPVKHWFNAYDDDDIVALEPQLAQHFHGVVDIEIKNGWRSHMGERYLSAPAIGLCIAQALRRASA